VEHQNLTATAAWQPPVAASPPLTTSRDRGRPTLIIVRTLVFLSVAVSVAVSAQIAPLRLVSTAWPPFTNVPGQPRFALDLVETALGRIGLAANTTIVTAPEFTPSLLTGPFDGSAAAWKDAERERALIFSQPYLENRLVLVGRRGADVTAANVIDLTGKRIAIVEGYSYGDAVDRAGPVFVRSRSEEDSLARLLSRDVDYTLMDDLVVQFIVRNYPKESDARLQIGSTALITRELYFAVRRERADAASLVSRFNAQLRGMIADRTYHRLLHLDWIRADVNGDGVSEYVPSDDRPGPTPPLRVYALSSAPEPVSASSNAPGFYLGGTIYTDWASVPESYKDINPRYPDPRRSTGSIFKFVW
jgi:polar amino acid transport system substrate-binding protein